MFKFTKDGISVSTVLDRRRRLASGNYPVRVQVVHSRVQMYYPTGKNLTPEDWERMPTAKNKELVKIRESIENSFDIVSSVVEELASEAEFSFDALNVRLKKVGVDTLDTAFKAKIAELRDNGQIGTVQAYEGTRKRVEAFAPKSIRIDSISVDWLKRYEKHMHDNGLSQTTLCIDLRAIRTMINDARRAGIVKASQYPFVRGKYEIRESEGRKRALTMEQIGKIAHYDDGFEATRKYRDYWMFMFFCNGINTADFVKLKYGDIIDGEIYFVRQKTARTCKTRKEIRVPILPQMQAIIDKWGNQKYPGNYIFPILDGTEDAMRLKQRTTHLTSAINKRMREIGKQLGVGNISTYTARHSFATVLKRSGANIVFIQESLGHQDIKTTEHYLASFEKDERMKNAQLLTQF